MGLCGPVPLLAYWLILGPVQVQVQHVVPVLWLMPVTTVPGKENLTAGIVPAIRLALQDLRRQPPPLGSYEIHLQLLDSRCDPAAGLKALFDTMWAGPEYLMVFGGVCPSVTALIARSLPALSLVQVSFATMPPGLSNRKLYRNFFSTAPSDRALNQATVKLLQHYKWTRVGVFTQEGPRLSELKVDLIKQLLKAEVQLISTQSFSDDACSSLRMMKERDVRIIIGQFEEDSAAEVFCCAYRLNLFGSRYQWILSGGWRLQDPVAGCTEAGVLTAADGSIRLQTGLLSSTNTAGVSGRTPQEYLEVYLRQVGQDPSNVNPLHAFAYDAVWVAARAFAQAMEAAKYREKYSIQPKASVGGEELLKTLLEAVKQTQFDGVTGPVFFRSGERMTRLKLLQFQSGGGGDVLVGEFSTRTQQLKVHDLLLKFKGSGPPKDQTVVHQEQRHVSLLLYAVMSSAAAVTIIITLSVLLFAITDHKRRLLPLGGPSQDELLLLGILLSSASILLSGLDDVSLSNCTFEILCSVRLWTFSVGHTVGFAVLLSETWSVYSLCRSDQKQTSGCAVLWMFLLDVFVLTSWQILDPLRRVVSQHGSESDAADLDVRIQPYSETCSSAHMELWLTAVCGYKAPLLGLGCFLGWNVGAGQVDRAGLRTERLRLSMAAVTVCSGIGACGSLLTSRNPPVQFCLTGVLILSCNSIILVSLFGPKLLPQQPSEMQGDGAEERSDSEEHLSNLNLQLQRRTAQLDVEIETITMQLCELSEDSHDPESRLFHMRRQKSDDGSMTLTHVAQICGEDRNSETESSRLEDINSPEHVRRRLSLQLPILHHSYVPAVGGIIASRSSVFHSHESFVHDDVVSD